MSHEQYTEIDSQTNVGLSECGTRFGGSNHELVLTSPSSMSSKIRKALGYWTPETTLAEVRSYVANGGLLTVPGLEAAGRKDLEHQIYFHLGGLRHVQELFGVESGRVPDGYWSHETALKAVNEYVAAGGVLTSDGFKSAGRLDLLRAVHLHLGGLVQIQKQFGVETAQKPAGYWSSETALSETKEYIKNGGVLSSSGLSAAGREDLLQQICIQLDGLFKVKELLGIENKRRPANYWNVETIINEVSEYLSDGGILTHRGLKEAGRTDISSAMYGHHISIYTIKKRLGISTNREPRGFLNSEIVLEEVKKYITSGGDFSSPGLRATGRKDLLGRVQQYLGGVSKTRDLLGITADRKARNYWNKETTLIEINKFLSSGGVLSSSGLRAAGREDLLNAIHMHIGGISDVRMQFGVEIEKKPNGYWSPEKTLFNIQEYVENGGELTVSGLILSKRRDLLNAIQKNYGGVTRVRSLLWGEQIKESPIKITQEEARTALKSLVEEI